MRPANDDAWAGTQAIRRTLQDYGLSADDSTGCEHAAIVLVRLDCGAGGTQFRCACLACWRLTTAIPHAIARAEIERTGIDAPLADLDILHAARDAYCRHTERLL